MGSNAIGTSHQDADITNFFQLIEKSQVIQPTHVVNCAAYTDVDGAEKNAEKAYAVNADGAGNLAKVAKMCLARFVHVSTDYVFNGKSTRPYLEDDEREPINVYGQSKRAGEFKVLENLPTACILRTSWVFGPRGKNFISSVLHWLKEKEEFYAVTDQMSQPTYCNDLAQAVIDLLDAEGIVHFANRGERSRYQIASDVMQAAHDLGLSFRCKKIIPVSSERFPTPAIRPEYTVLDTTKYFQLTKHRPREWSEVVNEFLNHATV
jgi:dTDP-4-dehydrorhamnose reductase